MYTELPEQRSERRDRKGPCSVSIWRTENGKEIVHDGRTGHINGPVFSRMKMFAQHYLNGLRIAAFLIRHGFNRLTVRYVVGIYENWIYPVLYRN